MIGDENTVDREAAELKLIDLGEKMANVYRKYDPEGGWLMVAIDTRSDKNTVFLTNFKEEEKEIFALYDK